MKKLKLLAAAIALALCAAAAAQEATASLVLRSKQQKWGPDGHYYTAQMVMAYTDVSQQDRNQIIIFAQAPDDLWLPYSAPAVGIWGFAWPAYRHRIVNSLHSLHGGGVQAVMARRYRLVGMIRSFNLDTPQGQADRWKMGLLIHALGDSYAHVHETPAGPQAYNELYGHILAKLQGENPDKIDDNMDNYRRYLRAMYCSTDRGTGDAVARRRTFDDWADGLEKSPINWDFKKRLDRDEEVIANATLSVSLVNEYLTRVADALDQPPTPAEAVPDACTAARVPSRSADSP